MEGRQSRKNQDRLKLLSGQFLLLVTLLLNIATTFAAIWTIFKLGLNESNLSGKLFNIDHGTPIGDVLTFNKDVAAFSLIVKDQLGLDEISNEMISFIAKDSSDVHPVAISLNPDYISMQARSYGPGQAQPHSQYLFRIDREVDRLDILGTIHNVRSLRSIVRKEQADSSVDSDLAIVSNDQLELSGNLGMSVHSKDLIIESGDRIIIESKEESLEIRSALGGLSLPDLHVHQEHLESIGHNSNEGENSISDIFTNQAQRASLLCIRRSDGMVYKAAASCNWD